MQWLWNTLEHLDPATWARAVAYIAIMMMCLFVAMQWRRGVRALAVAGMAYCLVRIVTTVLNALRLESARALLDFLTVSAVWLVAAALAVTIYYWLRMEPYQYDRLET